MRLSLRTKTIIISLCALIVLALALSVTSMVILHIMKERLVADAVNLAREQVQYLKIDIQKMLEDAGVESVKDLRELGALRQRLEGFERDNELTFLNITISGPDGDILIRHEGGDEVTLDLRPSPDRSDVISEPLIVRDRPLGNLDVMLSHSRVMLDIQRSNRFMRAQMIAFLIGMSLILTAMTFLLWRMFRRHLEVIQRQDRMERMAYVGTLASGLAHEIRNPLNAMGLKLQVLEEDVSDPEPDSLERIRSAAGTIRHQVAQLNKTVGNFLSFALPQQRAQEDFDVSALIHETRELLAPEFERRQVAWNAQIPLTLTAHGEPAAFQEVLINLFLNALQAMERAPAPRRLTVCAEAQFDKIMLEVADTGPGIARADLKRIFDVFYSTREGGSGFGLAIARRIVQDHGGEIEADNRLEGGAVFRIVLPHPQG